MRSAHASPSTDANPHPPHPRYVATTAGASISLAFELGGDKGERHAALWVGFLRSYEHMGRAEVVCSGGCACTDDVIDASKPHCCPCLTPAPPAPYPLPPAPCPHCCPYAALYGL